MKLVYQYMVFFFTFSATSNHLHPLQVENCGSNSRLVVDNDDYGYFRLERVNHLPASDTYVPLEKIKLAVINEKALSAVFVYKTLLMNYLICFQSKK